MGRIKRLISTLPAGEWRQHCVDYSRMKSMFQSLIDTRNDPATNAKKYRLFWSVMRSEGDRHAQYTNEQCESLIEQIANTQWDNYLQTQIHTLAQYMISNIFAIGRVLDKYQKHIESMEASKDTEEKRQMLVEFLQEQWEPERTAHRKFARTVQEQERDNAVCPTCNAACYVLVHHNHPSCPSNSSPSIRISTDDTNGADHIDAPNALKQGKAFCIVDLAGEMLRANDRTEAHYTCPICHQQDGFTAKDFSWKVVSNQSRPPIMQRSTSDVTVPAGYQYLGVPTESSSMKRESSGGITETGSDADGLNSENIQQGEDSPNSKEDSKSLSNSGRNKRGYSCHQCKTSKPISQLYLCQSHVINRTAKRVCHKKYCASCLQWCYQQADRVPTEEEKASWLCPACKGICSCAACKRRKKAAIESTYTGFDLSAAAQFAADPSAMHYMQNVAASHAANMYGYAPWGAAAAQAYPAHPHAAAYHHPPAAAPAHGYPPAAGEPYYANAAMVTPATHPGMHASTASAMPHSASGASATTPYFGHLQHHPQTAAAATAGQHAESNPAASEVIGKLNDLVEQLQAAQSKGIDLRGIQAALTHQQQIASSMGLNGHPATVSAAQVNHANGASRHHLHIPQPASHSSSHSTSPRPEGHSPHQIFYQHQHQQPQAARPY